MINVGITKRIEVFFLCSMFVSILQTSAQEISAKDYFSKAQEAYNTGNCPEAIRLGTEAVKKCEQEYGKENPYYVLYLVALARYYNSIGDYQETIRLDTEALHLREKLSGKDKFYANILGVLASCYALLENYPESIRLFTEAVQIQERILGVNHPDYLKTFDNLKYIQKVYADKQSEISMPK